MVYESCFPSALYGQGGFYDPEAMLAGLVRTAEQGKGQLMLVAEVFGSFSYQRPAPEHAWAPDKTTLEALTANYAFLNRSYDRGASAILVDFGESFVKGAVVYATCDDGLRVVYETYRSNDRPYVALPLDDVAEGATTVPDDGSLNFFLGSAGSSNYGHWLVDDLPRLRALSLLREAGRAEPIRIFLTSFGYAIDRVRVASLLHFCRGLGQTTVQLLPADRAHRFQRLLYTTPVTYHPILKSPQALAFLAASFQHVRTTVLTPLRIFVSRRDNRSRTLQNRIEVEALVSRMGFTIIDVEQMDFVAQASTFAAAGVVVGCMGAAMTNTVFCGPGTHVVHLAPEGWQEPFYWDIAAVQNHRYSILFGEVEPGSQAPHLKAFTILVSQLEIRLSTILDEPLESSATISQDLSGDSSKQDR